MVKLLSDRCQGIGRQNVNLNTKQNEIIKPTMSILFIQSRELESSSE